MRTANKPKKMGEAIWSTYNAICQKVDADTARQVMAVMRMSYYFGKSKRSAEISQFRAALEAEDEKKDKRIERMQRLNDEAWQRMQKAENDLREIRICQAG